jgi:hypothetical protein
MPEKEKTSFIRALQGFSVLAVTLAAIVVAIVGVAVTAVNGNVNAIAMEVFEGVSKIIGCFFVAKISLDLPSFVAMYAQSADKDAKPVMPNKKALTGNLFW